jgi:hypothetical protein
MFAICHDLALHLGLVYAYHVHFLHQKFMFQKTYITKTVCARLCCRLGLSVQLVRSKKARGGGE